MTDLDRQKSRLRRIADRRDDPSKASWRQIGWLTDAEMIDYVHYQWIADPDGMHERSLQLLIKQEDWVKGD